MKIDSYESFIDGIIEWFKISAWFILISIVLTGIVWFIFLVVDDLILSSETLTFTLFWPVFPISLTLSFPGTLIWYYYRKARTTYNIDRFRDIWMGFSVSIELSEEVANEKSNEIRKWLKENTRHMHKCRGLSYIFVSKSDALAFKLTWYE